MAKHRSLPEDVDKRVRKNLENLHSVIRHNALLSLAKRTRIITGKAGNIVLIHKKR